jgi:hypothetical protein
VLVVGSADGGDCADAGTVHVLVVVVLLPLVLVHLRTSTDQVDVSSIPPTSVVGRFTQRPQTRLDLHLAFVSSRSIA